MIFKKKINIIFLLITTSIINSQIRIISSLDNLSLNLGYNNINSNTNGELKIIQNFIKPQDVVFDVGANIGEWSQSVLQSISNCKIFTFEPIIFTFDILKKNVIGSNILHNNLALSDTAGVKTIRYFPQASALTSFNYRPILEETNHLNPIILKINAETIDNFCKKNKLGKINFLKIDTEGHEFSVLKGCILMLQNQNVDVIQFEYGGTYKDAKITLKEVYQFLTNFGFSIFRIYEHGLIRVEKWQDNLENYQYCNYLAIHKNSQYLNNLQK